MPPKKKSKKDHAQVQDPEVFEGGLTDNEKLLKPLWKSVLEIASIKTALEQFSSQESVVHTEESDRYRYLKLRLELPHLDTPLLLLVSPLDAKNILALASDSSSITHTSNQPATTGVVSDSEAVHHRRRRHHRIIASSPLGFLYRDPIELQQKMKIWRKKHDMPKVLSVAHKTLAYATVPLLVTTDAVVLACDVVVTTAVAATVLAVALPVGLVLVAASSAADPCNYGWPDYGRGPGCRGRADDY